MDFKIDKLEENRSSGKTGGLQGVIGLIESIMLITLAVIQINQIQTNVWKIIGFVVLGIVGLFVLDVALDALFDFNDWIKKKVLGKKSSHDIHYENLEKVINLEDLKQTAEGIKQLFGKHLETKIEDADYFGFYRGLNIEITPYTLETGKMKLRTEPIETWLCEIKENPDTDHFKIKHSDVETEIKVERPLLPSMLMDEWKFTLKPLLNKGWTHLNLHSISLTPNHRYVKFCLRKNEFLFIYYIEDISTEVIQDNF